MNLNLLQRQLALLGLLLVASLATGSATAAEAAPVYQPEPDEAVIYFKREDGNYDGWGLHLWDGDANTNGINELEQGTTWDAPLPATGIDPNYGAYYVVPMNTPDWEDFMFIVHKGNAKELGGLDHHFSRADAGGQTLFTFAGVSRLYSKAHLAPPIDIEGAKAHWVDQHTLAFNPSVVPTVKLFYSENADIRTNAADKSIEGGQSVELERTPLSAAAKSKFPHLADHKGWAIPDSVDARTLLKGQLVVATFNPDETLNAATRVQTAGVLDDLYAEAAADATLGATTQAGQTRFALWAPTAQAVTLNLYHADKELRDSQPMQFDAKTGIWSHTSASDESGRYYRYQISVFHPETDSVETHEVTDPYSLSLATNSAYSQVVDLNSSSLKPDGWDQTELDFVVDQPEQIVVYESQLRDLTYSDRSGNKQWNGTYKALTETERESMQHVRKLQRAGLTHLHLMPSFDIATIDEKTDNVVNIDDDFARLCDRVGAVSDSDYAEYCDSDKTIADVLAGFPADSPKQQDLMGFVRSIDSFNWGYDPFHYTVPEGSYATEPEGSQRILEYREMVQAIHDMDLNVVMDVVYNHTNQAGIGPKSVLDRIVPGYYHRLNPESGAVENSTCCENTATEHDMMEKLMIDSLIVWARDYQIDAFRFDLMGHHMKRNMEKALTAVQEVRPHVYFYGEGWNFGEVKDGARGDNAIQWTMAGTGIGTFSDRLRDAVRGGGPFDEGDQLRHNQGFGNGLYHLPNEMRDGDESDRQDLMHKADQIRVGLAGNLRDYVLINKDNNPVFGRDIDYNGMPAGYTLDPGENISYVSKHDNQTLWDNNQYRIASDVSTADRVRMQNLGLATNMMAQGIPFFHLGSDMLRSKSMERDSYDSGDWFNIIDFSFEDWAWGHGLPRKDKDGNNWHLVKQAFANHNTWASANDRRFAADTFREFLSIRSSSPLFKLETAAQVKQRVDFHNTGKDQIAGVIAMSVDDGASVADLDSNYDGLMVVINATPQSQSIQVAGAGDFILHPLQQVSVDDRIQQARVTNGTFEVPALSVAVFVQPQQGEQGQGLPAKAKDLSQRPPLGSESIYLMGTLTSWDRLNADNELQFVGNGTYALELSLDKGFYKLKTGNNAGLEYGKIGTILENEADLQLDSPGGVMNLRLTEGGVYRFALDMTDSDNPNLTISKAQ